MKKQGFTWIELLVCVAVICLLAAIALPAFSLAFEKSRRGSCQNNLRIMGATFAMYSLESAMENFPSVQLKVYADASFVSPAPAIVMDFGPTVREIYPEYLSDPWPMFCPSDRGAKVENIVDYDGESRLNKIGKNFKSMNGECNHPDRCMRAIDQSYIYSGFVYDLLAEHGTKDLSEVAEILKPLMGDRDLSYLATKKGPRQMVEVWESLLRDFVTSYRTSNFEKANLVTGNDVRVAKGLGNKLDSIVYRLHLDLGRLRPRFYNLDDLDLANLEKMRAETFVLCDRVSTDAKLLRHGGGSNVLYMDGHVEFVKVKLEMYPFKSPVSTDFAEFLEAMIGLF